MAIDWLLDSGIQNINKGDNLEGSFNSWFDISTNKFSFAYSEITGYGINTLLYLCLINKRPDNIFLDRAKKAADWLMYSAYHKTEGGILCRFDKNSGIFSPKICTFDNAMCLNALVNLYKETKNKKKLDFSIKIAEWLLKMQKEDGSLYPRYLINEKKVEEKGNKWSKQSGSFHAKGAIGLLNLGLLLNEEKYIKAAKKICDFVLKFQQKDGRFITDVYNSSTFLHPACYTAEGLLICALILKDKKYVKATRKFLKWILKNKLKTNGFPAYFLKDHFIPFESPEINSQVLRLCLIINAVSENILKKDTLSLCVGNIIKYQSKIRTKETLGGFYSGRAWFYGESFKKQFTNKHVNSWVTMFILQFLYMFKIGFRAEDIFYLV